MLLRFYYSPKASTTVNCNLAVKICYYENFEVSHKAGV